MQPKVKTDIEARVKDTGDTMTGNLIIKKDTSSILFQNNPLSKTGLLKLFNNGAFQIYTTDSQEDNIWLGTNTAQLLLYSPDVQSDIKKRFLVGWGDQAYGIYHTGNKPTTNDITYLGRNLTTADTDTVDFWKSLGSGHAMIDTTEVLAEQPYQWCWLENRVYADWVIQELHGANQKSIWRRYGLVGRNDNKFEGTPMWKEMLDSANYNKYALPLSGGTLTGDLYLLTGDNDRYIWFDYSKNASSMGASWRIGHRGSGSGDANHFVIQTTGSNLGTSETWRDVVQCWMNTKQVDFFANIYAKKDSGSVTIGCIRTDNSNQINLMVGSGGGNKGLYDTNLDAWLCFTDGTDCYFATSSKYNNVYLGSTNVYVNTAGVLYGAAWNDYAEYRESIASVKAGKCVKELGNGKLQQTEKRLEPGCLIVSDTFGYAIGQTEICQTPVAVSGRVLVYPAEDKYSYEPGDAVCSAPNGKVSKMTRREIIMYPERIIGTVSEIPEYERWGEGNVLVDGRIWISIK